MEVEFAPSSDDYGEQFVRLFNPNRFAVDVSDWQLRGPGTVTLPSGAVIPAGGTLFVARDVTAFRARAASPTGGEGHFVVGGLNRLPISQQRMSLVNNLGATVDTALYGYADSALKGQLVISEIHYNPQGTDVADGDDFEFIELTNATTETIVTGELRFVDGISITIPTQTITAGASIVLVQDAVAFAERYPAVTVVGEYDGKLRNSGESLALLDMDKRLLASFAYSDDAPWPESADGDGYSLERLTPTADPAFGCSWRASDVINGTPGAHIFANEDACSRLYLPVIIR